MMEKVNLAQKFSSFSAFWEPKIVAELNGQHVKLSKFRGPFVWHEHEQSDELFLVVKGSFDMRFRDRTVTVGEGEFLVVPRDTEHCPVAEDEVHVLLFEPVGTVNTGNVRSERTVDEPEVL
jgi:mannose-6-phosphate isomerase-like protein (cupin superfamily)